MCMHVCLCVGVCAGVKDLQNPQKGIGVPRAGVTSGCDPAHVGAGN